ncbi:hypothetical protein KC887_08910 [Candidatus Kaiserbacteria bacterium]|nr:hypothetical protein [Candidatus Kaiserbacteria bacterium]
MKSQNFEKNCEIFDDERIDEGSFLAAKEAKSAKSAHKPRTLATKEAKSAKSAHKPRTLAAKEGKTCEISKKSP